MIVLVTGGSGLVGNSLKELGHDWIFPTSKEMNLLDREQSFHYMEKVKPDVVIHLAARVGGLYKNINNNSRMFIDNMHINMNIVDICDTLCVKRFICILSTCIFPDKQVLTEDDIHMGPPHSSNEGYAMAKRMLEVDCRLRRMNTLCLIPTNLFGKHDTYDIDDGHVIPALIHKCYIAKSTNSPFIIRGTGKAKRQFLYSGDFAKIIEWSVYKKMSLNHETYICSTNDDDVSIEYIATTIATIFNYDNIIYDTSYQDGQHQKTSLNTKLMKEYHGEFSNFEYKLKETIEHFCTHVSSSP